jgi:mono/diheme cytochrome c family protein
MASMTRWLFVCAVVVAAACGKRSAEDEPWNQPGSGSSVVTAVPPHVTVPTPPPADPAKVLVERGAYIAKLAGCGVCHTPLGPKGPDFSKSYAGGLEMPDVIGTWRSPNITPDKSSGIGGWTDEQIITSIREGVRPDGGQLFPIMPYPAYNHMTDADAKALVAFLRSLKPIINDVAPTKNLKMPQPAAQKPANTPDDADHHGEYVATLMLCSHCHTTPGPDNGPLPDKSFAGGMPFTMPILGKGTLYAANITSDPTTGIGTWTEEQIAASIKTMMKPDGKIIQGPMLFLQGGWAQLDDADVKAAAAYIKKVPPIANKVPAPTFKPN